MRVCMYLYDLLHLLNLSHHVLLLYLLQWLMGHAGLISQNYFFQEFSKMFFKNLAS